MSFALPPLATLDAGQIRLRKLKVEALLPDLKLESAARAGTASDPQTLRVSGALTATLANVGTATAAGGIHVLAFHDADRDGRFDASRDTALGEARLDSPLAAAATAAMSIPVAGPLPFRDAPIHVWADSAETVTESDEANNLRSTAEAVAIKPDIGTFEPVPKWAWNKGQVIATPIVGPLVDTNADGTIDRNDSPTVVFVNLLGIDFSPGILTAVSGEDGHEL